MRIVAAYLLTDQSRPVPQPLSRIGPRGPDIAHQVPVASIYTKLRE